MFAKKKEILKKKRYILNSVAMPKNNTNNKWIKKYNHARFVITSI